MTSPPLQKAIFIKRYKRFLADVEVNGATFTTHCPNSGSMKGLLTPGNAVWLSSSLNLQRKFPTTLEIIESEETLVGVNTHRANEIVHAALKENKISELGSYSFIKREVVYNFNSRIDFLLTLEDKSNIYLEVKNVTLKEQDCALFPDSPTQRGTKHLEELMKVKTQGDRAVMLYLIQRDDCKRFSVANHIDPLYCKTLKKAITVGVEILAYQCTVTPSNIWLNKPIKVDLDFL